MAAHLLAHRRLDWAPAPRPPPTHRDPIREEHEEMAGWLNFIESGHGKSEAKRFPRTCKLSLTSETSERLMYHPDYRFSMYSYTHHGCDILEQALC